MKDIGKYNYKSLSELDNSGIFKGIIYLVDIENEDKAYPRLIVNDGLSNDNQSLLLSKSASTIKISKDYIGLYFYIKAYHNVHFANNPIYIERLSLIQIINDNEVLINEDVDYLLLDKNVINEEPYHDVILTNSNNIKSRCYKRPYIHFIFDKDDEFDSNLSILIDDIYPIGVLSNNIVNQIDKYHLFLEYLLNDSSLLIHINRNDDTKYNYEFSLVNHYPLICRDYKLVLTAIKLKENKLVFDFYIDDEKVDEFIYQYNEPYIYYLEFAKGVMEYLYIYLGLPFDMNCSKDNLKVKYVSNPYISVNNLIYKINHAFVFAIDYYDNLFAYADNYGHYRNIKDYYDIIENMTYFTLRNYFDH